MPPLLAIGIIPNALGGGWFGEVYPKFNSIYRLGTAGVTNVLVSSAQRELTGEQNSLATAESDFAVGLVSGYLGETVTGMLGSQTKWSGTSIESMSSFLTHTNMLSALIQRITQ